MTASVNTSARAALIWGLFALVLLIGGGGVWAVFAQITGAILAQGQVEVTQNRQVVQHPGGGVIAAILVREGGLVREGDILLRLDTAEVGAEITIAQAELFELSARRARLEAERDDRPFLVADKRFDHPDYAAAIMEQQHQLGAEQETTQRSRDQFAERQDQTKSQLEGIAAQQAALATQLDLLRQELAAQQTLLDRGLSQTSQVLALRREVAALTGRSGELLAAKAQVEGRLTELGIELLRIDSTRRAETIAALQEVQVAETSAFERWQLRQRQRDLLEIRAPVSGIIHDLRVFAPRAVIQPAEPILHIIPQDRPLLITSKIGVEDITRVSPGQPVTLRIPALDQRHQSELTGEVTSVSADVFAAANGQPAYYRAEIGLTKEMNSDGAGGLPLLPGMQVDVFIRTEARSPLTYLLAPLTNYFSRAFRET